MPLAAYSCFLKETIATVKQQQTSAKSTSMDSQVRADGAAGARRAAAILGIAACAETSHSTLDQDSAKVDLKITFRHAFCHEKLLAIHVQVKSGQSYRANSSDNAHFSLNIGRDVVEALSGTTSLGLIVWVPPPPMDRVYWYSNNPRATIKTPLRISREQYVRPSIRYDLTRLCMHSLWTRGFLMQTVSKIDTQADESRIHQRARDAYNAMKAAEWKNPLVGNLHVTRLAWRHVTRRSKARDLRVMSLRAVPYLKAFLEQAPDRFVCNQGPIENNGRYLIETRHLVCWYRQALSMDNNNYSLMLRIKETVSYPSNWDNTPLGLRDIRHCATLASWWCKREK